MKRMACAVILLTVMVLAAGCTAGPAGQVTPSPSPLAAPKDPIVGTYGADVNQNRLQFNEDKTFKLETPGQSYVGVWEKQDSSHYRVKYMDPQTGKQMERVLIYDANDRSLNFEGEPTVDYVWR